MSLKNTTVSMLSLPLARHNRKTINKRDIPAEIDRIQLSYQLLNQPTNRPPKLDKLVKAARNIRKPTRRGPDAPATVHRHVPAYGLGLMFN